MIKTDGDPIFWINKLCMDYWIRNAIPESLSGLPDSRLVFKEGKKIVILDKIDGKYIMKLSKEIFLVFVDRGIYEYKSTVGLTFNVEQL